MRNLTYLTAFQYEVQRFACVAQTTLPHKVLQDIRLESGQVIKNGVVMMANLYQIMRDPQYFKYPEEFNPCNFLDETGTQLKTVEAFVPYGVGPRICLGQILADLEVKVFIIEIVRKFKVTSPDDIDLSDSVQNFTCAPQKYRYSFEPRSND